MSFEGAQVSADGKKIYALGGQPRSELVRYDSKSQQFLPYPKFVTELLVSAFLCLVRTATATLATRPVKTTM